MAIDWSETWEKARAAYLDRMAKAYGEPSYSALATKQENLCEESREAWKAAARATQPVELVRGLLSEFRKLAKVTVHDLSEFPAYIAADEWLAEQEGVSGE